MGKRLSAIGRKLKGIERANKVLWRALHRLMWRNRRLASRLNPATARRVLFLRYDAIGDMLTTLPAFALLKQHAPQAAIDVVASPRNRAVIEDDPNVDTIIEMPGGFGGMVRAIRAARRHRYDAIICCIFGRGTKVGIIANLIGGGRTVKSTIWREDAYYTYFNVQSRAASEPRSMWERTVLVLADTFAIPYDDSAIQPYVAITPERATAACERLARVGLVPGGFLLLNLSVSHDRNRWGQENFVELARAVAAQHPGLAIALMAMPAEHGMAGHIARVVPGAVVLPPLDDVRDAIATVAAARIVFTPDTGVVHMASATGRPVVALYAGGVASVDWAPCRVPHLALVGDGHTVAAIGAPEAYAALAGLLLETEAAPPPDAGSDAACSNQIET